MLQEARGDREKEKEIAREENLGGRKRERIFMRDGRDFHHAREKEDGDREVGEEKEGESGEGEREEKGERRRWRDLNVRREKKERERERLSLFIFFSLFLINFPCKKKYHF